MTARISLIPARRAVIDRPYSCGFPFSNIVDLCVRNCKTRLLMAHSEVELGAQLDLSWPAYPGAAWAPLLVTTVILAPDALPNSACWPLVKTLNSAGAGSVSTMQVHRRMHTTDSFYWMMVRSTL